MTAAKADTEKVVERSGLVLYHNAATFDDLIKFVLQQPFTAMCGKECNGKGGPIKLRDETSPIEHCAVCRELTS